MPSTLKIAFVSGFEGAYTDRLIRGMAKAIAALQKQGIDFRLRDFPVADDTQVMPAGFEAWSPDAVITFLPEEYAGLFGRLKQYGRPVIHNAMVSPDDREGELAVLSDRHDAYRVIHEHFRGIGRERIAAYFVLVDAGGQGLINGYRAYCQSNDEPCEIVTCPQGIVEEASNQASPLNMDSAVVHWLKQVKKPIGLFAVHVYGGAHLCRLCAALGLRVPEDVAIIGVDGFEQSAWTDPPQTGLCFDTDQIAGRTLRLAHDLIRGKAPVENIIYVDGASLVVRGSTVVKDIQGVDVQEALRFIEAHALEGVSMTDIVEHTQGVSRQTFVKYFKAETGMTPNDAIRERKVDEARRLLRDTEVSITTLAGTCGFCDDGHFRRVFSKTVGCTPSAYRKMQRAN